MKQNYNQHFCEIIEKSVCNNFVDMKIKFNDAAKNCSPGQFIHVLCGENTFLRRPLSICDIYKNSLRFIFEVKGAGTKALSKKNISEKLDILAPLGNGFDVDGDENVVLIGGGIGCFPLLSVAKNCGKNTKAILGFRSKSFIYDDFVNDFQNICDVSLMTDDGSVGKKGFTTDELEKLLIQNQNVTKILTCGPKIMMDKVIAIAKSHKIPCYASLEERMGCGYGTCLCCATKLNEDDTHNFCVCKDGPVFRFN